MTTRPAGSGDTGTGAEVGTAARLSRLYLDALRAADGSGAYRVASGALRDGMSVPGLYQRVIAPAMHEIGDLWERGALTIADEHLATAVTGRVLAALRPPPAAGTRGADAAVLAPRGRAMFATVEGEQHALGLQMAADVLEGAGFEAIVIGADVPADALLEAVGSHLPDLVALSATMASLAPQLERVSAAVRRNHPRVEVLIGGQAASPRSGGTLVQDFEVLAERVLPRSQV